MDMAKAYVNDIMQFSLLKTSDEIDLYHEICQGSREALEKLITANLRLVLKIANDFKGQRIPFEDLVAVGNIGLMHAAERFDPYKGSKFSSYAAWWIKRSMRNEIHNHSRLVRIPIAMNKLIHEFYTAELQLLGQLNRIPTNDEIATKLKITIRVVKGVKKVLASNKGVKSIDEIIDDRNLHEQISAESKLPSDAIIKFESSANMGIILNILKDREKLIIIYRYGLNEEPAKTLDEISKLLKYTRERIRQIQCEALRKMRFHILISKIKDRKNAKDFEGHKEA